MYALDRSEVLLVSGITENGMPNYELLGLYQKYWSKIKDIRNGEGAQDKDPSLMKLSWPLLLKIHPCYHKQKVKLMIVGQQTGHWGYEKKMTLEGVRNWYGIDESRATRHYAHFWKAIKILAGRLNISCDCGISPAYHPIVWSNLVRMDCAEGEGCRKGRPRRELAARLVKEVPLLPEEIRICRPDLVVFFTGPTSYYREMLELTFPGVSYEALDSEFDIRQLAKLTIPQISAVAYRTCHPGALRKGWPDIFEKMASKIISDFHRCVAE